MATTQEVINTLLTHLVETTIERDQQRQVNAQLGERLAAVEAKVAEPEVVPEAAE